MVEYQTSEKVFICTSIIPIDVCDITLIVVLTIVVHMPCLFASDPDEGAWARQLPRLSMSIARWPDRLA
jgi:hypothetical protein